MIKFIIALITIVYVDAVQYLQYTRILFLYTYIYMYLLISIHNRHKHYINRI